MILGISLHSFRSHFILGAFVWISLALALSGDALSVRLRDEAAFIYKGEIEEHAVELGRLVKSDDSNRIVLREPLSDPRFLGERSGYYWQVERSDGVSASSPSLGAVRLPLSDVPLPEGSERFSTVPGPTGDLLFIEESVRAEGSPHLLRIGVGIDEGILNGMASRFDRVINWTLFVVGAGLLLATATQLHLGFRFLARIREAFAKIRIGEASRLPEDLPDEFLPLVKDFNALIGVNEQMVRRARLEAGNLAHALKTPLAILMHEAERLEADGRSEEARRVHRQCERMQRAINYQLVRTRACVTQGGLCSVARIGPLIQYDVAALSRLHAARGLSFDIEDVDEQTTVACAAEDFEEMFASLVDNAAKWAVRRVRISTSVSAEMASIRVEDDGAGLPKEARDRVFEAGERLDELTPGSGLGLAIVRDLANLYGGRAWIEDSELGGASACFELPIVLG